MKFIPRHCLYRSWPWWLAIGLILVQFLPALWLTQWLVLGGALAVLYTISHRMRAFALTLLLVATGSAWGSFWGGLNLQRSLPAELVKQDVVVTGRIQGLAQQRSHALRFAFKIDSVSLEGQPHSFSGPVLLNWYDKPYPDLQSGDRWALTVKLKPAHGSVNPGSFNYEKWLFSQRIRATGYVRQSKTAHLIQRRNQILMVDPFRARIKDFIDAQNLSMGGILSALSIGERSAITQQQWQVFRNTGTAHLIAISGLHIGLVAGLAYFLGQWLWRHSMLVTTQFPAQRVGKLTALLAALVYAALAGFALPTLRAFSMLLAYFALQWMRRSPSTLFALGFVLAVVLVLDPLAPLQASLWLSFGAVAAIAYVIQPRSLSEEPPSPEKPGLLSIMATRLSQWTHIQWAIFVALMPLLLLFFGQFSIISLPANAVAIPLIGLLLVPVVLLALLFFAMGWVSLSAGLFSLANTLLEFIWPLLESLSEFSYAIWQAAPPLWAVGLAMLAALVLLAPKLGWLRFIGAFGFIPLFLPKGTLIEPGEFKVHVLDVGQGLAVVVQTAEHTLLYDTGIKYDSGFDSGSAIVLPFLQHTGIKHVDTVVASHQNIDHYGGFDAILETHPEAKRYAAAGFFPQSTHCDDDSGWNWDDVGFRFLHPATSNQDSKNNGSCVLHIQSHFGSMLLTGDIERKVERKLVTTSSEHLPADVLLVPHHGSHTSSSLTFIKHVNPKLAVISAGYLNQFNHPHDRVIQRYRNNDIDVLKTASSGAIQIGFNASGIQAIPWRSTQKFYWLSKFADAQVIRFAPIQQRYAQRN